MATFTLSKSGKTFDFDTSGEVKRNGTRIGKWSTSDNDDNQLVVTDDGGTATKFTVGWRFNKNNQLELFDGANTLLNFNGQAGVIPLYKVENAVLFVKPDRAKSFSFNLNGEWKLTGNDLSIKLGSTTSVIDGYVEDNRSQFIYKFLPKAGDVELYTLTFAGSWTSVTTDGKQLASFHYTGKKSGDFTLPESLMFDRSINQLVYEHDKDGKTRRLQFMGELKLGAKGSITYKLDRQKSGTKDTVASTSFAVQAAYKTEKATGDLELVLLKKDGTTPGTSLVIGGNFEHDLGSGRLKLGFRYTYEKSVGVIKENKLILNGEWKLKNGDTTLVWQFSKDSVTKVTEITFGVNDFEIGPFQGNLALMVKTESGELREIRMLLGFRF
jgi:hypothetical protein